MTEIKSPIFQLDMKRHVLSQLLLVCETAKPIVIQIEAKLRLHQISERPHTPPTHTHTKIPLKLLNDLATSTIAEAVISV